MLGAQRCGEPKVLLAKGAQMYGEPKVIGAQRC